MSQLNIRINKQDYEILKLISEKDGIPITTLFKSIINPSFYDWKLTKVMELYQKGALRFKDAAKMSGLSLTELIIEFSKRKIEPPHTEEMERASEEIANSLTRNEVFKNPNFVRKSDVNEIEL